MAFTPLTLHHVEDGACTRCGRPVPASAVAPDGTTYTHGDTYLLKSFGFNWTPCLKSTDKSH
jgi:hypothetical protein